MPQGSSNLDPLPAQAMCCDPLVDAWLSTQRAELYPGRLAAVVALTSLRALV